MPTQSFSQTFDHNITAMKPSMTAPTTKTSAFPSPANLPAAPVNMGSPEEVGVAVLMEDVLESAMGIDVVPLVSLLLLLLVML